MARLINKIVSSKKDQKVFFDSIFKKTKPNKKLKSALKAYKKKLNA